MGANNGVDQSNTLYFEKYRGWTGILIEPVLHNYFLCKKFRSHKNKFFCNACVSFDYKDVFVPIYYSNLMSVSKNSLQFTPQHIKELLRHLPENESPVLFGAVAKTLNSIMLEADAPKIIDLISLDVEGAKLDVLRGVDFSAFSFAFMCIESGNIEPITEFLRVRSYRFVDKISFQDYLFAYEGQ